MKKRVISGLLAILAVMSLILPIHAAEVNWTPIRVDGKPDYTVEYEIRDGVCYVTVASFVRAVDPNAVVEEASGKVCVSSCTVTGVEDVEGSEDQANVVTENLTLTVKDGSSYIEANGRCLYTAGGVSTLNGSVAVPVRVLGQVFNLDVGFDNAISCVVIDHREDASAYLTSGDEFYNADNLLWLSRIINAESGNQSLTGKIAVGNVVMNRVNSKLFPNNIYDVLFQKSQFGPASSGSIYKTPNQQSVVAAKLVLEGVSVVPTALFFNRAGVACYASRNRTYVTTIGAHAFYA